MWCRPAISGRGRKVVITVSSMSLTMPNVSCGPTTNTLPSTGSAAARGQGDLAPAGIEARRRQPDIEHPQGVGAHDVPGLADSDHHLGVGNLCGEEVAPAPAPSQLSGRAGHGRLGRRGHHRPAEDPHPAHAAVPGVGHHRRLPATSGQQLGEGGVTGLLDHACGMRSGHRHIVPAGPTRLERAPRARAVAPAKGQHEGEASIPQGRNEPFPTRSVKQPSWSGEPEARSQEGDRHDTQAGSANR